MKVHKTMPLNYEVIFTLLLKYNYYTDCEYCSSHISYSWLYCNVVIADITAFVSKKGTPMRTLYSSCSFSCWGQYYRQEYSQKLYVPKKKHFIITIINKKLNNTQITQKSLLSKWMCIILNFHYTYLFSYMSLQRPLLGPLWETIGWMNNMSLGLANILCQ